MNEPRNTYTLTDGTTVSFPAHVQVLSVPELVQWFRDAFGEGEESGTDSDDPR